MFKAFAVLLLGVAIATGGSEPETTDDKPKETMSSPPIPGDVCNMKRLPQPAEDPTEYFACALPTQDVENWPWPQIGLWVKRSCTNEKLFSPVHHSCRKETDIRRYQQRACQQWPESCGLQIDISCGGSPCPQPFQPQPYVPPPQPITQPQPYVPQPQPCQPPACPAPQPYVQPYQPAPEPQPYVPQPQPCQPPACPAPQPYVQPYQPAPQPIIEPQPYIPQPQPCQPPACPAPQPYVPQPEPYIPQPQPCQPPACPQPQPYVPQPQPYVPQPQPYVPQPQPYVPQPQPYVPQSQPCQPPQTCGSQTRPVDNTPRPCPMAGGGMGQQGGYCSWMMARLQPAQSPNSYMQCVPVSGYCGKWMTRPCAPGTRFDARVQVCVHAQTTRPQTCGGNSVPLGQCNQQQQCPGYSSCQQQTNTCCQPTAYGG